jgi:hypothetical protein
MRVVSIDMTPIYSGVCRSTDSAGMAFLSHGVIAGGRIHYEPTWNLEEGAISRLRNNVMLLNKLNVRKMVDDFGYLILKNVSKMGFPIDDICR